MKWQIYKRRGGVFRRLAVRGEEYDGSRWELHKSYATEEQARQALEVLESRAALPGGVKRWQYKIVTKGR